MKILLIEDNPADILLAKEGFKMIGFNGNLDVLADGNKAVKYLKQISKELRSGKTRNAPDLILLDLNLPKVHGLELLKFVKLDRQLHLTPVVILTTSLDKEDISSAYSYQANSYLIKPMDFNKFVNMLDQVVKYWSLELNYHAVA